MQGTYYIVVLEWLYPTESGRELVEDYDTLQEALARCSVECEEELPNYEVVCGDSIGPDMMVDSLGSAGTGYIVSPKNGLDEWYFLRSRDSCAGTRAELPRRGVLMLS